jgi:membrane associated rhomboid family serine protease
MKLYQIIILNVIVFALSKFTSIIEVSSLYAPFNYSLNGVLSVVSYSFLHSSFIHLLLNMALLIFMANLLKSINQHKHLLKLYLLGATTGAIAFLIFSTYFNYNNSLIGASAAVRAITLFTCLVLPNKTIAVFASRFKLKYFAVLILGIDIAGVLLTNNSGGYISHIGGAIAGVLFFAQKRIIKKDFINFNTNNQL